ncbi:MAG: 5-oxoprolinase subunit B family protein [Thermoleophilia bacterium]
MIFEEPRYLYSGDRYLLLEFGDEMNLDLNFKALGLAETVANEPIPGVVETVPSFATLLVHYEPEETDFASLKAALAERVASLGPTADITLPSRLVELPCCYDDPWTKAAVDDYRKKIKLIEPNPEATVRLNGLRDVRELIKVHSTPQYWVAAVGFWPGLPFMMSLDPRYVLTVPKYNPPRTWTPQGTVGMGGSCTAIYPVNTPGGYQIFGRTPVPIWDGAQKFAPFAKSPVLLKPGDRVKFVPIDAREFIEIEQEVAAGTYTYNIVDYELFAVARYTNFFSQAKKDVGYSVSPEGETSTTTGE